MSFSSRRIRATEALRPRSTFGLRYSRASRAASCPANTGAANEVPLQMPKPEEKSSMSSEERSSPRALRTACEGSIAASYVVGIVLTSEAPGRWNATQGPSLLNSAIEPSGLSAPTAVTGTTPRWSLTTPLGYGANAAG